MIFNIKLNFLKNFTLYILSNLLLLIPSLLQSLIQRLVLATQQNDEIKVIDRKYIRTMKIEEQPSGRKVIVSTNVIDQFFFTELGNIELFVPNIVEYIISDELTDWDVCEAESLIDQLAKGSFSSSRCSSH